MKKAKNSIKTGLQSGISFLPEKTLLILIKLYLKSLKIKWVTPLPPKDKHVFLVWHGDLPVCIPAFAGRGVTVMLSASRDGRLASRLLQALGYKVHSGSSSKGFLSGVRALVKALEQGKECGMALDGPRGPVRVPKKGTHWLSRKGRAALVPITVNISRGIPLRSWDQAILPFPFSKVSLFAGKPFFPAEENEITLEMKKASEMQIKSENNIIKSPIFD